MYELGYLGANNAHYHNLRYALEDRSILLRPLDHSLDELSSANMSSSIERKKLKAKRIVSQLIGSQNKDYQARLIEYFRTSSPKVIVAYWGSNVIGDVIKLKKYNPNVFVILNVLCHPMGLTTPTVKLQNMHMKYASRYFDGYIFSSKIMQKYFEDNQLFHSNKPSIIIPPLMSKQVFPQKRLPDCVNIPNIVYLGRPDWWAGQPSDNVNTILNNAIKSRIHVYSPSHINDDIISDGYCHTFRSMKLELLSEFTTQFDASLIIYNTDVCGNIDRFKVTIPDRLIASVASGIPIAIPKFGYDACKEFLKMYQSVIEFESFDDLKNQLKDREALSKLKETAIKNSSNYTLEGYVDKFIAFTKEIGK